MNEQTQQSTALTATNDDVERTAQLEARTAILTRAQQCKAILESKMLGENVKTWQQVNALWLWAEAEGMGVVEAVASHAIYCDDRGNPGYYADYLAAKITNTYGPQYFRLVLDECNTIQAVAEYLVPGWETLGPQRITARIKQGGDPVVPPDGVVYVGPSSILKNFGWTHNPQNQLKRWLIRRLAGDVFQNVKFASLTHQAQYRAAIAAGDTPALATTAPHTRLAPPSSQEIAEESSSDANGEDTADDVVDGEWGEAGSGLPPVPAGINPETGEIMAHTEPAAPDEPGPPAESEADKKQQLISILLEYVRENPATQATQILEEKAAAKSLDMSDFLDGCKFSTLENMVERLPQRQEALV